MPAQWLESRWLGRVGLLDCWPGSDLWIWFASGNFSKFHRSVLAGNLYGYWQWGCRESEVVKGGPSEANHVNVDHRMRTPSSLISKRPILQQMQRKLSNHTALCNYLCTRPISEQTLVKSGVMKTKNMSYTKRRTNSTVHDYNQNITNLILLRCILPQAAQGHGKRRQPMNSWYQWWLAFCSWSAKLLYIQLCQH